MAVDLDRVRQKLQQLRDPKKFGKFDKKTWSIKEGETKTIRLLQYPFSEDPFIELFFHYGIGKNAPSILCPRKNSNRPCPICEFNQVLNSSNSKEDKALSKQIYAKQRFYAAMVDRSDPTLTPKYWGFGKEMCEKLLDYLTKNDYRDFLEPLNGLDAELTCVKSPTGFNKIDLTLSRKESRLADTDKKIQEIKNAILPIEQVFQPMTTAEINDRLTKWINLGEEDGNEVQKGGKEEEVRNTQGTEKEILSDEDLASAFDKALE